MNSHRFLRLKKVVIACACALFMTACSEPYRSTVAQNPVPAVKAALVLSDSAPPIGGTLVASVHALAGEGTVGSYTAKISYDATALRFDGEIAISDQAMRASNPSPGLVRFAGAAAAGFVDGHLASYRFVVLRPNSVRSLSLAVDEMHMITRLDAKTGLILAPNTTIFR